MGAQDHEARIENLEMKFAYQEDGLRTLGDIVTAQAAQIERLNLICRQLVDRVQGADGGIKGTAAEEVPPHY